MFEWRGLCSRQCSCQWDSLQRTFYCFVRSLLSPCFLIISYNLLTWLANSTFEIINLEIFSAVPARILGVVRTANTNVPWTAKTVGSVNSHYRPTPTPLPTVAAAEESLLGIFAKPPMLHALIEVGA